VEGDPDRTRRGGNQAAAEVKSWSPRCGWRTDCTGRRGRSSPADKSDSGKSTLRGRQSPWMVRKPFTFLDCYRESYNRSLGTAMIRKIVLIWSSTALRPRAHSQPNFQDQLHRRASRNRQSSRCAARIWLKPLRPIARYLGSFLPSLLVGSHHQSLLGSGSRHCYGINYTYDPAGSCPGGGSPGPVAIRELQNKNTFGRTVDRFYSLLQQTQHRLPQSSDLPAVRATGNRAANYVAE
jgi:hypothetical protein